MNNIDKIISLQKQYQKIHDMGIQFQKSEKEIKQKSKSLKTKFIRDSEKFRKGYLKRIWDKKHRDLLKVGVTKKRWNSRVKSSTIGQTPSIDFSIQSMIAYMVNNTSNLQNSRKLLTSDHVLNFEKK